MDRDKIRQQAKDIMDEFARALEGLELEEDLGIERSEQTRVPNAWEPDEEFRERFLKNAPKTKDGYLAAEKKKW